VPPYVFAANSLAALTHVSLIHRGRVSERAIGMRAGMRSNKLS
jgi:hypothetical protein